MRYLVILLLLFSCSEPINIQTIDVAQKEMNNVSDPQKLQEDIICIIPESMPQFPGGFDSLQVFFQNRINWKNLNGCVEGKVFLIFTVEKDGTVSNLEVLKGIAEDYDKEAIRNAQLMPKWKPGAQRGESMKVRMAFPVRFRL